jgi:hypothetical protein
MRSYLANGDIYPSRFVKIDTSVTLGSEPKVIQAGAGDRIVGISMLGTRRAEYIDASGKAAAAGEPLQCYDYPDECRLELGGTVTAGARIKSDANGKGVVTTTDKDQYGAYALESGVAGELIRVKILIGEVSV